MNETFTSQLPESVQARLAEILDDYLTAIEQGSPICPEDLLEQHPYDAEYLAEYLSGLKYFHAVARAPNKQLIVPDCQVSDASCQRIGDYELRGEIGRGGMGVVYDAVQLSLGRRVALKVLPLFATHDEKKIQRFKNEARAAASIEHPNIVPIYAVGQTAGVHFYAMQLIEGRSLATILDDWRGSQSSTCSGNRQDFRTSQSSSCSENHQDIRPSVTKGRNSLRVPLPTVEQIRTTARWGYDAARALHAAHECGVVHRDIKPSNLIVDENEKLWVTDFGLASCRDSTGLTQTGDILGTMRYMSPEQATGRPELIDRRTDVYSLGVTLYELASLEHPSGATSDAHPLSSQQPIQQMPLRTWNREIPTDFQTIVMKSIAENPLERYATCQELAADLARFVDGRPIQATSPSRRYRVHKFLKRHRRLATVLGALLVVAVVAQSANTFFLQQSNREKEMALDRAHENLQQAHAVLDRFGTRLVDQLVAIPGAEGVRYQLLNDSLKFYEQFEERTKNEADGQGEWKTELAHAYSKMGSLSEKLGHRDVALEKHLAARNSWQQRVHDEPMNRSLVRSLAICQNNVGLSLAEQDRPEEGLAELLDAESLQRSLIDDNFEAEAVTLELAMTFNNLGMIYNRMGDRNQAKEFFQEAIARQQQIPVTSRDDENVLRALAVSYNNLAALNQTNHSQVAESNYRQAIDIQFRLIKSQPVNRICQSDLACTYNNLGFLMASKGDWANAEVAYRDAKLLQEHLVQSSPMAASYRRELAVTLNNLGMAYDRLRKFKEAESSLTEAIRLQRILLEVQPNSESTQSDLGGTYNNWGLLLAKQQRFADAQAAFELAIENQKLAFGASSGSQRYRDLLSNHYANYSKFLREDLHRKKEAEDILKLRSNLLTAD